MELAASGPSGRLARVGRALGATRPPARLETCRAAALAPPRRRVLGAGIFHETHSFVDERTPLSAFATEYGEALLAHRHDDSPLAGLLQVAEQQHWDLLPVIDMRATPSGLCEDAVLEHFWEHVSRALDDSAGSLDGIFLVLHGAMATVSFPDCEEELVCRLHTRPPSRRRHPDLRCP